MKPSPSNPGKMVPALAKIDNEFLALQEHDDPVVATAACARLEAKSTLLETRIQKMLAVSARTKGMKMAIPLRYAGAGTTGRWSGEVWNPQNLPRIDLTKPKLSDALRKSLVAPEGYTAVTSDLSGIELRVNMFLWKVQYAMDLFEADPAKADLYKTLASKVLEVPYDELTKMQRAAGKAMHLGCGFGLGSTVKFVAVAKTMAQIDVTEEDAKTYIAGYRTEHPEIVAGWKACQKALVNIHSGIVSDIDPWGLCKTGKEHILLPSGRKIWYTGLHQEIGADGKREWWYGEGRNRSRIYGPKVVENICQALARDVLAEVCRTMRQQHRINPALLCHDEFATVVPTERASEVREKLDAAMRAPTSWWPALVKWSESEIGANYGATH
jgi:DNA polymerase